MNRILPAIILLSGLAATQAQAQRNGDVANGRDYQPTQGEVRTREKAAGILPPPAQQQRQTGTVDSIYNDLMKKEGASPAPQPPAR